MPAGLLYSVNANGRFRRTSPLSSGLSIVWSLRFLQRHHGERNGSRSRNEFASAIRWLEATADR